MNNRNSSIELCRLIAMLMILILHADYVALKGAPEWQAFLSEPLSSFFRVFFEQASIIGVNVFVLISGWFGITTKREKICSLLFQVFFLSCLICFTAPLWGEHVTLRHIVKTLLVGSEYWFVVAYLILCIFAPILNRFIESSSQKNVLYFLLAFYFISTLYGFFAKDIAHFSGGYSAISFMGLYVLARYIRIYSGRFFRLSKAFDCGIYLICTLLGTAISIVQIKYNSVFLGETNYNNPIIIIASVYFFLFFTKNAFHSRIINYLGSSAFAIYLIHNHPFIFDHYCEIAQDIYVKFSGLSYLCIMLLFMIGLSLSCIFIDKIRHFFWSILLKTSHAKKNPLDNC